MRTSTIPPGLSADILLNCGTQARAELNQEVIQEYAEKMLRGDEFPAMIVYYDGRDYYLADGYHRLHAGQKAGLTELPVDIRQGTRRDAVLYSVGANATHGLRRTNADKRRAVETLLRDREWSQWSDREIARHTGVSDRFVNNVRAELFPNGSQIERTATRKGTTYTVNTAKIGSKSRDDADGQARTKFEAIAREPAPEAVATATVPRATDSGLVQFQCPMTPNQRETLYQAINQAKSDNKLETTAEGLCALAATYLKCVNLSSPTV